jgi:hypothetical protein
LGWFFIVTPAIVRPAAERYADALIAAASNLA